MAFRFQSFRFLADYPSVYLHCRAYSCANTDNSVECDQNCRAGSLQSSVRRRRDLPRHVHDYQVDSGPIVVIESSELTRLMAKSNGKSPLLTYLLARALIKWCFPISPFPASYG